MMKSALLLLFLLFGIASGNLLEQRNYGTWSKVQNPIADKPDWPARYFLCGFQFELTQWLRYYRCKYLLVHLDAGGDGTDGDTVMDAQIVLSIYILEPLL